MDSENKFLFRNIIDKSLLKKLNKDDTNKLLIKKKVLKKEEHEFPKAYIKKAIKENLLIEKTYFFDEIIHAEIIQSFFTDCRFIDNSRFIPDNFATKKKLEIKLKNLDGQTEKINLLRKELKKTSKKLQKVDLYFWSKLTPEEFGAYGSTDFLEHVSGETGREVIIEYISNHYVNWHQSQPYSDWIKIVEFEDLINYYKEEINKINNSNEEIAKTKETPLTSNQKLILIDKIRCIETNKWDSFDNTKKAILISRIIGNSSENIRKNLPNLEKSPNKLPEKFKEDILKMETLIKNTLG
jgi:hypothetical protein